MSACESKIQLWVERTDAEDVWETLERLVRPPPLQSQALSSCRFNGTSFFLDRSSFGL